MRQRKKRTVEVDELEEEEEPDAASVAPMEAASAEDDSGAAGPQGRLEAEEEDEPRGGPQPLHPKHAKKLRAIRNRHFSPSPPTHHDARRRH